MAGRDLEGFTDKRRLYLVTTMACRSYKSTAVYSGGNMDAPLGYNQAVQKLVEGE